LLLLLLDTRSPAGAHNHSAGMEPAIAAGMVRGLDDVEAFCRGRLRTSGRVAAAFAGAACDLWLGPAAAQPPDGGAAAGPSLGWDGLDAEFDARTPSEAVRAASRQLGHGLRRMVASMLPTFDPPWTQARPHHPLVLGAAVGAAGGSADLAARAAALGAVSAPAGAAVRLLGLDPFAVQAVLARLAAEIDGDAESFRGALPAFSAPALDLLADFHLTTEVRLFAS
jgi:urease accessory protein